mmetsp:Transcript_3730/g.10768  ORF Transcript_3730/g.10768 Transcript_3730/m.10768 type:complete len:134 (+) Transcript_3730:160-561(+)
MSSSVSSVVRPSASRLGVDSSLRAGAPRVRQQQPGAGQGSSRQRLVCHAMYTVSSSSIQGAVRQSLLLLGSGIYGMHDLIKRWEATDPKVRDHKDREDAVRRQKELGYGFGNPSARPAQLGSSASIKPKLFRD